MLRLASYVGVLPEPFWEMTLRDFFLCVDGFNDRQERDTEWRAWEVAHHLNLWAKTPVTGAALLGKERAQPLFLTVEDWQAHMRKRKAEIAAKKPKKKPVRYG